MGLGACPRPWGHALAQAMGKRAVPDIQPPLLPASTLAGLVSGWWLPHGSGRPLWTPTLVGRWKPPSTTACLACTLGPDTPTWQVGLGSGDLLGQGGLGEGVTGKGVTAEHRRSGSHEVARGTQEPPSALLPHSSPHLLAGRGENPHTAISGAGTLMPGVGAGPPGWFSSSLTVHGHGDRMETCQGSQ